MQLDCWNIQGESFHFGRHGLGQEQTMVTMPSDSLFAALVARLARTHGKAAVDRFCADFVGENPKPPFVISSTFPYAGGVKFFPVPMLSRRGEVQGVKAKDLKEVKYVSEGVFRALLGGASLAEHYNKKQILQGGKLLATPEDFETLPVDIKTSGGSVWHQRRRSRVTLGRESSSPNLFHIGQIYFAKDCGLWFGMHWLNPGPENKKQFKSMLCELATTGFGAERGVGLGIAQVSESGELDLPDATGTWVTLSRYLPARDETAVFGSNRSAYSIKSVGGWLDSPVSMGQRRISVNLIEEGSVIGDSPLRTVPGQVVDVRPHYQEGDDPLGHPVWRYGLALAVGMNGGAG